MPKNDYLVKMFLYSYLESLLSIQNLFFPPFFCVSFIYSAQKTTKRDFFDSNWSKFYSHTEFPGLPCPVGGCCTHNATRYRELAHLRNPLYCKTKQTKIFLSHNEFSISLIGSLRLKFRSPQRREPSLTFSSATDILSLSKAKVFGFCISSLFGIYWIMIDQSPIQRSSVLENKK